MNEKKGFDMKKYKIWVLILFVFCICISGYSNEIDDPINMLSSQLSDIVLSDNNKPMKIAVIDFVNLDGNVSELGIIIPEELTIKLFNLKKFKVVERRLLKIVLDEQSLMVSDLVSQENIKKVGNLLGVDAIVTGTIADTGDDLKVNARVISVESGEMLASGSATIRNTSMIKEKFSNFMVRGNSKAAPKTTRQKITADYGKNNKGNLVVNGDFTQDVNVGWQKSIEWNPDKVDEAGINWVRIEKEGDNSVLHLYHKGISYVLYKQVIPITDTKLILSFSMKYEVGDDPAYRSGFYCNFLGLDGKSLGSMEWEFMKDTDTFKDSPIKKYILQKRYDSACKTDWEKYDIDIDDILSTYLIGVDKTKIKSIRISICTRGIKVFRGGWEIDNRQEIWLKDVSLTYK